MIRTFLSFFLVMSAATQSAVFAGQESPALKSADTHTFVLFGGFGSCALNGEPEMMNMAPAYKQLTDTLQKSATTKIQTYRACYAITSDVLFFDRPDGTVERSSRRDLFKELSALAKTSKLTFIGQSHGGWTAMLAVLYMPKGSVQNLVTLDPISIVECTSTQWLASTAGTVWGGKPNPGCVSAPRDLVPYNKQIRESLTYWLNAWQDDLSLLHSSPIEEATENFKARSDDWRWYNPGGGHAQIETNPEVWKLMEQKLLTKSL